MYARNTNVRPHSRRRATVGRLTLVPGGQRNVSPDIVGGTPTGRETVVTLPGCHGGFGRRDGRVAHLGSPGCHRHPIGLLGRGLTVRVVLYTLHR